MRWVGKYKIQNVKVQMSKECQRPKCINNPPCPPLAKGGWGDLKFELWIWFGIWVLIIDI